MAATITVRRLVNGDPSYGSGAGDFLSDRDAIQQIIATRLKFLQGEWWEDLTAGFPLFQGVLQSSSGPNQQVAALLIQQQILGTPYVTGLGSVGTSFNGATRTFTFACEVQTQFGTVTVTFSPGASASLS